MRLCDDLAPVAFALAGHMSSAPARAGTASVRTECEGDSVMGAARAVMDGDGDTLVCMDSPEVEEEEGGDDGARGDPTCLPPRNQDAASSFFFVGSTTSVDSGYTTVTASSRGLRFFLSSLSAPPSLTKAPPTNAYTTSRRRVVGLASPPGEALTPTGSTYMGSGLG